MNKKKTDEFFPEGNTFFSEGNTTSYCSGNNIKSAVVYTNADIKKLEILKDNKGKSGIYL